jgi:EmrB/QacA subfamily drug resistance transporter
MSTAAISAPPSFSHPQILRVVRGVVPAILLFAVDQTIVVPALPRMAADLHGVSHLSWVIAAYLLTGTAATPLYGKLSDIYGRRRLLTPAIIIFLVASIGCAWAASLTQMIVWRAIQGLGGAGLITVAQVSIADVASPRERGRYQIYMSGMWGIASIGGPLLGGALTQAVSWRAVFWINVPLGLLALVLSHRALAILPPRPAAARAQKTDYLGALLVMAAIAAWLALFTGGGADFGWFSRTAVEIAAAAAVLTEFAILQAQRAAEPVLPPRLFRNDVVIAGLGLSLTNSLCTFGATLLIPLYFQYARDAGAAFSGLDMTPFLLAFVVFSYAGAHVSRRLGRTRLVMLAATGLCTISLAALATQGAATPLVLSILYMSGLGAGIGLVQPNITVAIQNAAERHDVGAATGAMLLFRAIGGAMGAALAGSVLLGVTASRLGVAGAARATSLDRLGAFPPHLREAAFVAGFHWAFAACAVAAGLSVVVAWVMRDLELRTK